MKRLPEPLRFSKAPREVRMAGPLPIVALPEQPHRHEQEAFERGKREGEKALSEQLLRQRAELLELQQGVLKSLRNALPEIARECERTLVALALETAHKLVAGLPISAEMVEAAVREALARAEETSDCTVLLNQEDLELLQRVNSPVLLPELGGNQLRFVAAKEVTRGGCVIQTRFGTIDAKRETKLELIKKSVEF